MLTAEAYLGRVLVSGDDWCADSLVSRKDALKLMLELAAAYQMSGDMSNPGAVFLRTEVEKLVLDLLSKEHA